MNQVAVYANNLLQAIHFNLLAIIQESMKDSENNYIGSRSIDMVAAGYTRVFSEKDVQKDLPYSKP